ncbi:MAG: glycosyltransferase family 2 protein [Promethearchaeota archaeon]|jgi:GT2 family glycosyltransferase
MQNTNPKISIVFPSYNGVKYLKRNLDSIKSLNNLNEIELVIIDNMSRDSSIKVIKSYAKKINIKLIENALNEGFAEGCNSGVQNSEGEFVFITNQDVIFPPDFFKKLLKIYYNYDKTHEVILSPALVFESGRIHYYGAKNHFLGFSYTPQLGENLPKEKKIKKTQRFCGGSLFIKKNVFLKMGGFDREYFMYHEDTDLSLKILRNGAKIYTTNDPFLIHQKERHKINKFQYFYLERNRFIILIKNVKDIKKLMPYLVITEVILILHSLFIKKFKIRLRVYIEIMHNFKRFKKLRKKSRKEMQLFSYQNLSKILDPVLLGNLKRISFFRTFLKALNRLFKLA